MEASPQIPSVWKNKEFIAFIFLRFSLIFALFIQSTSVAFEIFRITQKEIYLGLIGLFEFAPILFTAFYAGQLVDRLDKRKVIVRSIASFMLASFVLMIVNFPGIQEKVGTTLYWRFAILPSLFWDLPELSADRLFSRYWRKWYERKTTKKQFPLVPRLL